MIGPNGNAHYLPRLSQLLHGGFDNTLFREAELLLQFFEWSRGSERRHADDPAGRAYIVCPSECRGLFDCYTGRDGWRQDAVAIGLVLMLEQFPRGHTHDPSLHSFEPELLVGRDTQRDFTTGSDEDYVRLLSILAVGQDVGSLRQARGRAYLFRSNVGTSCRVRRSATGL